MLNIDKIVAKAELWLENVDENTHEDDLNDVKTFMDRLENRKDATEKRRNTWASNLNSIVKGTRLKVVLDEGQTQIVVNFATAMNNIFTTLPDLTLPRDRSFDSLVVKMTDAYISKIKAESK